MSDAAVSLTENDVEFFNVDAVFEIAVIDFREKYAVVCHLVVNEIEPHRPFRHLGSAPPLLRDRKTRLDHEAL